jgi:hypothetical protein
VVGETIEDLWFTKVNFEEPVWTLLWNPVWMQIQKWLTPEAKIIAFNADQAFDSEKLSILVAKLGPCQTLKIVCFHACVLRSKGFRESGQVNLRLAEHFLNQADESALFYYYYEQNKCHLDQGQYQLALESSRQALKHTQSKYHKIWILTDNLIALENLGYSHEETYLEIQAQLSLLQDNPALISAAQQFRSYQMRLWFRHGHFTKIYSVPQKMHPGQELYYQIWVSELPFQKKSFAQIEIQNKKSSLYIQDLRLKGKSYCLRTLSGDLHPEDQSKFYWYNWADRLYLWCWRWLANPKFFSYHKVLSTLSLFNVAQHLHLLTAEDRFMLHNVLGWLMLFDESTLPLVQKIRRQLQESTINAFPLLNAERQLIDSWYQRIYRASSNHPLSEWAGEAEALFSVLQQRCARPFLFEGIIVDLRVSRITYTNTTNTKNIDSIPMCRALDLLKRQSRVPVEVFSKYCFEHSYYSRDSHLRRVMRLLAAIRQLDRSNCIIRIQSDFVVAEINWENICIFDYDTDYFGFVSDPKWNSFLNLNSNAPTPPQIDLDSNCTFESASWREISQIIKKPRSTTLRIIEKWIKKGLLLKLGRGKNTRYTSIH